MDMKNYKDCRLLKEYKKRINRGKNITDIMVRQEYYSKSCSICKYKEKCSKEIIKVFLDKE